ncbi:MAG: two-component sensor histidine kinase, partial [Hydrogenophaga sp.]|nr:two-component sensor histidine kinase [Hydrogenophaga sp.]
MRVTRSGMWWWIAGAVISLAGAAWIARHSIEEHRALFETDARIVHRLLSQQAVQHDAILDTLALLQPAPETAGAVPPEQRLSALYPQILSVHRRDRDANWPDAALADAEARSRQL